MCKDQREAPGITGSLGCTARKQDLSLKTARNSANNLTESGSSFFHRNSRKEWSPATIVIGAM